VVDRLRSLDKTGCACPAHRRSFSGVPRLPVAVFVRSLRLVSSGQPALALFAVPGTQASGRRWLPAVLLSLDSLQLLRLFDQVELSDFFEQSLTSAAVERRWSAAVEHRRSAAVERMKSAAVERMSVVASIRVVET
jgi:hypothetical protein